MTNISRRSIAKGAAWSVPVMAVGAPAALAATSLPEVDCATARVGITMVGGSWQKSAGTRTSDEVYWGVDGNDANLSVDSSTSDGLNSGTYWSVASGNPTFIRPSGTPYTGVKFYGDSSREAIVRMVSGKTGTATVTGVGVTTPQGPAVASGSISGLSTSYGLQSTVPIVGVCPPAEATMKSVSIPVVVTWLIGLDEQLASNTCAYWLNYCYDTTPGGAGCYPLTPLATAYSLTDSPAIPC